MSPNHFGTGGPFEVYKREQAALSRRLLYPVTAFYSGYSAIVFALAWRTNHPYAALVFFLAGMPVWTLQEYLTHRYIFHTRFKRSTKNVYKRFYTGLANKYLDPLHWEHHERPYDGFHINGELKDMLPLFAVAVPFAFIFPLYTTPILLAGVIQSYVAEEWVHHCLHFYNFRNPYFRHVKLYHLYHHTARGIERGFGITSGFWDIVFKTRFPDSVRQRLFGSERHSRLGSKNIHAAARGGDTPGWQ